MAAKRKPPARRKSKAERMKWWREARFGMFIHWGLYAIPAGVWKNQEIPGIGEWIMKRAKIPVAEYEKLARRFNPTKFNAEEWVAVAKNAGMKYLVITAKHHDGFAMYHSKASAYNIVDATPFGRDPMAELAAACKKAGIRLCFYYSQKQDWHHPDASGNDWDYNPAEQNFDRYMKEKGLPQVEELLTQYGPIGLIWYDTPIDITLAQSRAFVKKVYECQPDCLVDGRSGHNLGDYASMGDNQIPSRRVDGDWETPATLNDTWGFKKNDLNWKPVEELLRLLIDIVSKGGNYLLNVGPTAQGVIPRESVKRLEAVGQWLKTNGEAIYGAGASPFPYELGWGAMTSKPGKLYLHIWDWPEDGRLSILGLKSKVKSARLLANKRKKIAFEQSRDEAAGLDRLVLALPAKPAGELVSVVALDLGGKTAQAEQTIAQRADGTVELPACLAALENPKTGPQLEIGRFGETVNWKNPKSALSWEFVLAQPGEYEVEALTSTDRNGQWPSQGRELKLVAARKPLSAALKDNGRERDPKAPPWRQEVVTRMGRIKIAKPGVHSLAARLGDGAIQAGPGVNLQGVRLRPAP